MRTILAIMLGLALSLTAEASSPVGSITGRAVNAAGSAVANQRVDLVHGGQVVNVATTNSQGAWSFGNLAAGEYTVRTSVNGKMAGVRVTVREGVAATATTIVVPTAGVAPQFGALSSIVSSLAAAGATGAAAAVQSVVSPAEATDLNAEEIVKIFNALAPEEQKAFATAVVAATSTAESPNTFKPAPVAANATTAGATNSKTNEALFNVLNTVSTTNTSTVNKTVIAITPSNGTSTGSTSASIPSTTGTVTTVNREIPKAVS